MRKSLRVLRTRFCRKVNGPAEPRAVLDRINAIIRERRQPSDEPLHTPTALVPEPQLLLEYLPALRGARIVRDVRADGARRLRERGKPGGQRSEEERKVWGGRGWGRGCRVRLREGIVRVCRFGIGRRREEGRGEEQCLIRG